MTYVAFLRGVNVGGRTIVSMARIKGAFERLGLSEVRTYINSGNIVFSTPTSDTQQLARRIEQAIEKETELPIKALVKSRVGLKRIVDAIPAAWVNDQLSKCDVMLLWKAVDRRSLLDELPTNPAIEETRYAPGAVIWRIHRDNLGKSKMTRIAGTPLYKQMTIRNPNTIRKLHAMMSSRVVPAE